MEQVEQEQALEQAAEEQYDDELPELFHVTIKDAFVLGFYFGLGLGAAVLVYGIIGFLLFITIIKELTP